MKESHKFFRESILPLLERFWTTLSQLPSGPMQRYYISRPLDVVLIWYVIYMFNIFVWIFNFVITLQLWTFLQRPRDSTMTDNRHSFRSVARAPASRLSFLREWLICERWGWWTSGELWLSLFPSKSTKKSNVLGASSERVISRPISMAHLCLQAPSVVWQFVVKREIEWLWMSLCSMSSIKIMSKKKMKF